MIEINLLPKQYRKSGANFSFGKSGLYVGAGVAALVVLLVAVTFWQMQQLNRLEVSIDKANQRAAMLRQDIQMVDALTDVKDKITRRMSAIERLDRNRSSWVRILEDVASDVPEFVWLGSFREVDQSEKKGATSLKNNSDGTQQVVQNEPAVASAAPAQQTAPVQQIEIEGYAFSLNSLAAFMINMMRSDFFDAVELKSTTETKFADEYKAYTFVLSANVHYLSDEELRQLAMQSEDDAMAADATSTTHESLN